MASRGIPQARRPFVWEMEAQGTLPEKGGCQRQRLPFSPPARVHQKPVPLTRPGNAVDTAWQQGPDKQSQRRHVSTTTPWKQTPRSASSSPAGKGQILPRPSDAQQSWPQGGNGWMRLPWEDPCPRGPARGVPFFPSKVPPGVGES